MQSSGFKGKLEEREHLLRGAKDLIWGTHRGTPSPPINNCPTKSP